MDDLKATYNKIAKDWEQDHQTDSWWIGGTEKFVSLLGPGNAVLDIGCGAGVKAKFLSDRGLRVTGIDFSEEMIKLARGLVPAGKFLVMDMKNIVSMEGIFSGIFAQAALLHIPKHEIPAILARLNDKLKPGGYLYIAVKEIGPDGKEEEIITENDYGYEYYRFFSFFTMDELRNYLKVLRMEIVHEDRAQPHKTVWLQIIARK